MLAVCPVSLNVSHRLEVLFFKFITVILNNESNYDLFKIL